MTQFLRVDDQGKQTTRRQYWFNLEQITCVVVLPDWETGERLVEVHLASGIYETLWSKVAQDRLLAALEMAESPVYLIGAEGEALPY